MIVIDASIVITALPEMRDTFGLNDANLSWIQNAYLLAYGGLLLVGARMGDLFGRRRMFVASVAVFTAASLAVGTALFTSWLLAARVIQGSAAAILAPSALALLQANFREGAERTHAIAAYSTAAGVGGMLGLVLGGTLTASLSWRIGFLVNVPIGVALIQGTRHYIPETERHAARLDLFGSACSTLGMTSLVYGLVRAANTGWSEVLTITLLVTSAVMLTAFVLSQARGEQPIMPLRLFASRERSGAYAARLLFVGAIMGSLFFMTIYLQCVLGFSAFAAGLAFVPMMAANFGGAMAVPKFTQRLGNAKLLVATTTITLVGMAWLSRLSPEAPFFTSVALPLLLIGAGGGASLAPLTSAGIAGVSPADAGAAAGLVNVAHMAGASLGLAILVVVASFANHGSADAKALLAHQVNAALTAGTVMLVFAVGVVLVCIGRTGRPSKEATDSPAGHVGRHRHRSLTITEYGSNVEKVVLGTSGRETSAERGRVTNFSLLLSASEHHFSSTSAKHETPREIR